MIDIIPEISYTIHIKKFFLLFYLAWIISTTVSSRFMTITQDHLIYCSVQSLSHVQLFVTSWTAACQTSLSITNSRSLLRLMSIESMMPCNHLTLCRPFSPAFSLFQHQGLSQRVSSSNQVATVLELQLQHQSFQ